VILRVALEVATPLIPDEELIACPFRVNPKSVFCAVVVDNVWSKTRETILPVVSIEAL
jgi:hypothetical protein